MAEGRCRARDVGIRIGFYEPGPLNAITDVRGVRVGHTTLIEGEGQLRPGHGPIRTGVTAVIPHDRGIYSHQVVAGIHILNGAGEMTGLAQVKEWGILETPIILTNTLNVGRVHDALLDYVLAHNPKMGVLYEYDPVIPVVAECDDSYLNDIRGRHVGPDHVKRALEAASSGPVSEGSVGAGTGMSAFNFKAGIGTSSRRLPTALGGYTVGALVLANFGNRRHLNIGGVPVGQEIIDLMPTLHIDGSVVVILAFDAPLDSRQLNRLAHRSVVGLGRVGTYAAHTSGELVLAFSTANLIPRISEERVCRLTVLRDIHLDPLFEATIEAVEEAVLNSLFAAETMTGRDGHVAHAMPIDRVVEVLSRRNGAV
ncbi:MAG: P1 family peptidase [Bacillota bacterium]